MSFPKLISKLQILDFSSNLKSESCSNHMQCFQDIQGTNLMSLLGFRYNENISKYSFIIGCIKVCRNDTEIMRMESKIFIGNVQEKSS